MEGGVWRVVYGEWCMEDGVPYALPAQAVSPSVAE